MRLVWDQQEPTCTVDAISTTLHSALNHLDNKDSYVRMLFLDFSSAFNTIIPQQLIQKLDCLGLNISLCNWLLDLLTGRPEADRVGSNAYSTIMLWPPKDTCSGSSSSPCWPMTAHQYTTPTSSSSLRTILVWWGSSTTNKLWVNESKHPLPLQPLALREESKEPPDSMFIAVGTRDLREMIS